MELVGSVDHACEFSTDVFVVRGSVAKGRHVQQCECSVQDEVCRRRVDRYATCTEAVTLLEPTATPLLL